MATSTGMQTLEYITAAGMYHCRGYVGTSTDIYRRST